MAAALGVRLPVMDPVGTMIMDIGGGTTDIAVISLGGVVVSKNLKVAGDKLNSDIMSYIRSEFKILVGEKTAEYIKISIGAAMASDAPMEEVIKGRDLVTGLPKEVVITDSDIREATRQSIESLLESAKEVLETTPPEIISDVMNRGIYMTGGGALIRDLNSMLADYLKIPVHVVEDPLTAVAARYGRYS